MGISCYFACEETIPTTMPKSKTVERKRSHSKVNKAKKAAEDARLLKPRRNRSGTTSLRETRKEMRSNEAVLKRAGTLRYMRAVLKDHNEENPTYRVGDGPTIKELGMPVPKISEDAVSFFGEFMEREMIEGIRKVYKLSLERGLQSVAPGDLQIARKTFDVFREYPVDPAAYEKSLVTEATAMVAQTLPASARF